MKIDEIGGGISIQLNDDEDIRTWDFGCVSLLKTELGKGSFFINSITIWGSSEAFRRLAEDLLDAHTPNDIRRASRFPPLLTPCSFPECTKQYNHTHRHAARILAGQKRRTIRGKTVWE